MMKPHIWRKTTVLEGNTIFIKGIIAMSWKVLMRAQRDSKEDWLRMSVVHTESTVRGKEEP